MLKHLLLGCLALASIGLGIPLATMAPPALDPVIMAVAFAMIAVVVWAFTRTLFLTAGLLLGLATGALAACDGSDTHVNPPPIQNDVTVVEDENASDVNECPRADGQPCK